MAKPITITANPVKLTCTAVDNSAEPKAKNMPITLATINTRLPIKLLEK
jgi:hypothetical protein